MFRPPNSADTHVSPFNNLQRAMEALKVEVSDMKKTAAEKRQRLRKETETHVQMKEDTEVRKVWNLWCPPVQANTVFGCFQIQNRRFEAIVRRLHLQLGRAQAAHRYRRRTFHLHLCIFLT